MKKHIFLIAGFLILYLNIYATDFLNINRITGNITDISLKDSLKEYYNSFHAYLPDNPGEALHLIQQFGEKEWVKDNNYLKGIFYYWTGSALLQSHRYDEAIYNYLHAKDIFSRENLLPEEASVLNQIGLVYRETGDYNKAVENITRAMTLFENANEESGVALSLNYLGSVSLRQTQYDKALDYYNRSLKIRDSLNLTDDIASTYTNIALVHRETGNYDSAIFCLQKAREIYNQANDRTGLADASNYLGSIYFRINKYDKALGYYQAAYNLYILEKSQQAAASTATNIGAVFKNLTKPDSAIRYLQAALKIQKSINNTSGIARTYTDIGNLYKETGNLSKAMEYYGEALNIQKNGNPTIELAATCKNIGEIYADISRFDKALEYNLKAAGIEEQLNDRYRLAYTLNLIGNNYKKEKKYDDALKYYKKSLQIKEDIGNRKELAMTLNNMGDVNCEKKEFEKAIEYYQLSLKAGKVVDDQWRVANQLNNLGNVYRERGDNDKAFNYFNQAYQLNKKVNNRIGEALCARKMGEILLERKDFSMAYSLFESSLKTGRELGNDVLVKNALFDIYKYHKAAGNYENALNYLKDYYTLQDSIREQIYNKRIADIQLNTRMETHESVTTDTDNMTRLVNLENNLEQTARSRNIILIILILIVLINVPVILSINFRLHKMKTKLIQAGNETDGNNSKPDLWIENLQKKVKEADATKSKLFQLLNDELIQPVKELKLILEENPITSESDKNPSGVHVNNLYPLISDLNDKLDNFLNWSGIQTGNVQLHPKMIFLKPLLDEIIQSYNIQAATKRITILNNVKGETTCHSDRDALKIILQNMIASTIKFVPNDGFIEIIADENADQLQLQITHESSESVSSHSHINPYKTDNDSSLSMIVNKAYLQKLRSTFEIVNSGKGSRILRITISKFAL
jgi:two-component system, sensor histidine kinase and response regulator